MLSVLRSIAAVVTLVGSTAASADAATLSLSLSPSVPTAGQPLSIVVTGTADRDGSVDLLAPGDACSQTAPILPPNPTPIERAEDLPFFSAPVTGGASFDVSAVAGQGNDLSTNPGIYVICGYVEGADGTTDAAASIEYTVKAPTPPKIAASFSAPRQTPSRSHRIRVRARCNQACQSQVTAYLVLRHKTYRLGSAGALMGSGDFGLAPSAATITIALGPRALKLLRNTLGQHQRASVKLVCTAQGDNADHRVVAHTFEFRLTG